MGPAAETEIQARTLSSLSSLREKIELLEDRGLVQKRPGAFAKGYGDAFEPTKAGLHSLG